MPDQRFFDSREKPMETAISEIPKKCLNFEKRVFVEYDDRNEIIRTATQAFWKQMRNYCFVSSFYGNELKVIPKRGTLLRILMWHGALYVKIEARIEGKWVLIYERTKPVPSCLVKEHYQ